MCEEEFILEVEKCIKTYCGFCVNSSHKIFLQNWLKIRIKELNISYEDYCKLLYTNKDELKLLVEAITINETYFFREEKQFTFIRDRILPSFIGKQIVIWSAACSTGEEAVSLSILAKSKLCLPLVYASDINTESLQVLKKGVYSSHSFRKDGEKFKELFLPYMEVIKNAMNVESFQISQKLLSSLVVLPFNLATIDKETDSTMILKDNTVDILFLRNVFIYFDEVTRRSILQAISKKLKIGGVLFFSMSEIAGIDANWEETGLIKQNFGDIYYFIKSNKCESYIKKDTLTVEKTKILNSLQKKGKEEREKTINSKVQKKIVVKENSKKDLVQSPVILFEQISNLINQKNLEKAHQLLDKESLGLKSCYSYYFRGIIYKASGKNEEATQFFEKSMLSALNFWPGLLQYGRILDETGFPAYKIFVKTAELLEVYIKNKQTEFDFLFESFSAAYLYEACQKYIQKELRK